MYGNIITIIRNTESDLNPTKVHILNISGKIISRVVISFENLVNILPIGFESKNKIFDLIIRSIIDLCKLVVLVSITIRMTRDRRNEPIIKTNTEIPKINGCSLFCYSCRGSSVQ